MKVEFVSPTRIKLTAETDEDMSQLMTTWNHPDMVLGNFCNNTVEFDLPSRFGRGEFA